MKIFAHRGYSAKYMENSRQAFESLKELQVDGVELDLQLSRDREIVVFHDEKIDRLLPGSGLIKDYSLKELREFSYRDGQKILTLSEYLDIAEGTSWITNVELKTSIFPYEGIEKMVYREFSDRSMLDRLIISSFNHLSLMNFKEIDASIPLGALEASCLINPGDYLERNSIDYYHPLYIQVDEKMVEDLSSRGIGINCWTCDDKKRGDYLKGIGVSGLITNDPKVMLD